MQKNLIPILYAILDEKHGLIDLRNKVGTFDHEFCSRMDDNKVLKHLKLNNKIIETYRDLDKVFAHDFCKKQNFNLGNTLLIDSDNRKI